MKFRKEEKDVVADSPLLQFQWSCQSPGCLTEKKGLHIRGCRAQWDPKEKRLTLVGREPMAVTPSAAVLSLQGQQVTLTPGILPSPLSVLTPIKGPKQVVLQKLYWDRLFSFFLSFLRRENRQKQVIHLTMTDALPNPHSQGFNSLKSANPPFWGHPELFYSGWEDSAISFLFMLLIS